jgi:hypothetical protein
MIVEIRAVNSDNVRSLLNAFSQVDSFRLLQAASVGLRPSEHIHKHLELPTRGGQMRASGHAKGCLADVEHRVEKKMEVPRVRARAR